LLILFDSVADDDVLGTLSAFFLHHFLVRMLATSQPLPDGSIPEPIAELFALTNFSLPNTTRPE
ncbi:hypothetical protein T10_8930, partial [Trichinella papuae]